MENRLDKKAKIKFKIHDIKNWITNNYNTHIAQISRNNVNQTIKFGQLKEIFSLKNHPQNAVEKLFLYSSIKIKVEHISGPTV